MCSKKYPSKFTYVLLTLHLLTKQQNLVLLSINLLSIFVMLLPWNSVLCSTQGGHKGADLHGLQGEGGGGTGLGDCCPQKFLLAQGFSRI